MSMAYAESWVWIHVWNCSNSSSQMRGSVSSLGRTWVPVKTPKCLLPSRENQELLDGFKATRCTAYQCLWPSWIGAWSHPLSRFQQHGPVHWRLCPKGQSIECSFCCGPTNRWWIPRRLHQGSHLDSQVSTASGASCWWVWEVQLTEFADTIFGTSGEWREWRCARAQWSLKKYHWCQQQSRALPNHQSLLWLLCCRQVLWAGPHSCSCCIWVWPMLWWTCWYNEQKLIVQASSRKNLEQVSAIVSIHNSRFAPWAHWDLEEIFLQNSDFIGNPTLAHSHDYQSRGWTTLMAQQLEKLLLVQSCMRRCLPSSRSSDPVAINLPLLQQDQPAAEGVSSGWRTHSNKVHWEVVATCKPHFMNRAWY